MKTNIQGLVLRVDAYKEVDALVKVLTQNEILTLYARGIYKKNSKNLRLVQPFSYCQFMIEQRKGMPLLLQGQTIKNYYHVQQNLEKSSVCFVLHDCIRIVDSFVFDSLLEVWNLANDNQEQFYNWACYLMRYLLILNGIHPYVDGCVSCQSSKVEALSIKEGGFLCSNCNRGRYSLWEKDSLRKYRALFKCDIENFNILIANYTFNIDDFIFLAKWFEFYDHKMLNSLKFLKDIYHLK